MLVLPGLKIWGIVTGKEAEDHRCGDTQSWDGGRGAEVVQKAAQEHPWLHTAGPLPWPALCPMGPWHRSAQAVAILAVPTAPPDERGASRRLGHTAR